MQPSAKHDVAVIQAALKNIKVGGKSLWPGRIDGRKNNVLEAAIVVFQLSRNIKPTGKVETNGPTIRAKGVDQQLVNKLEAAVRPGQFQMEDVALFIHGEMIRNAEGSTAAKLRAINKASDLALADGFLFVDPLRTGGTQAGFIDLKLSAYGLWIAQVFRNREWDHKKRIMRDFGNVENHPDPGSVHNFFFDIWSNIHYGYIGKSVGFSRLELVSGAGLAQAIDNENLPAGAMDRFKAALRAGNISALGELDEITDRAAAELGIGLWDNFGAGLSFQSFLDAVRAAADRLKTGRLR